jgi:hypothetical protein
LQTSAKVGAGVGAAVGEAFSFMQMPLKPLPAEVFAPTAPLLKLANILSSSNIQPGGMLPQATSDLGPTFV